MGLGDGSPAGVAPGELEGRKRAHELWMGCLDVAVDLRVQGVLVLSFQDLPTTALDDGCHPAN
jgi:hypothetical protein